MTTMTDAKAMETLLDAYHPARPMVVSMDELNLITDTLELNARSDIELQNIRDFAVLYNAARLQNVTDPNTIAIEMDRLSGITAAIDSEKAVRGIPV